VREAAASLSESKNHVRSKTAVCVSGMETGPMEQLQGKADRIAARHAGEITAGSQSSAERATQRALHIQYRTSVAAGTGMAKLSETRRARPLRTAGVATLPSQCLAPWPLTLDCEASRVSVVITHGGGRRPSPCHLSAVTIGSNGASLCLSSWLELSWCVGSCGNSCRAGG